MEHKLSIVIPCYNCETTLEEALRSIYDQDLDIPFEVIMVDDGSFDGTHSLMNELSKRYANVRCISHDKNRGGGAARNTGIKNSDGDLIFCLDSDNFFAKGVLSKMIKHLDETGADGAVIEERRFFRKNNPSKYESHVNYVKNSPLSMSDLFITSAGGILLDNFLFTRRSFEITGGYPENHGFDTQCFEFRFLSRGNRASVCPGAVFYHRQNEDTYFKRVYKKQGFSVNFYLIFEEVLHLLSRRTRKAIMEFDIFKKGVLGGENIRQVVDSLFNSNNKSFFIESVGDFVSPEGSDAFFKKYYESEELEDIFANAAYLYRNGRFEEAMAAYAKLIKKGFTSKVVYYNMLRAAMALSGKTEKENIEGDVLELITGMAPEKPKSKLENTLFKISKLFRSYVK